jgi:hypothetical protein
MVLHQRVLEIENKDFHTLTEEELVIYNYWNTYKEANLYYSLMVSCIDKNMKDLGLVYANKGKISALKALALQSKIAVLTAANKSEDLSHMLSENADTLKDNFDGATRTIVQLETKGEFGNVIEIIAKPVKTLALKTKSPVELAKSKLEAQGLAIPEDATPVEKANVSLKILDSLFLTGQISQSVYNKKCREVMLKKPKSA